MKNKTLAEIQKMWKKDCQIDDIELDKSSLELVDLWILSRLNSTISETNGLLDSYKLNEAIKIMYNFIWKDYCDWYIEFSKNRMYGIWQGGR